VLIVTALIVAIIISVCARVSRDARQLSSLSSTRLKIAVVRECFGRV
jgi:hypothetical protein